MDFRVWAPKATTVEIALDNTRIPMTPYSGDGWTVDVQEAGPGIDYALRLDSPGSEEVRQFVCDSALMWLRDHHLDGLRLDAVMDRVRVHGDEHACWLTVERGPIIVACNLATRAQRVPIGREQSSEVLLTSDPMIELNESSAALPPDSVVVLEPGEL